MKLHTNTNVLYTTGPNATKPAHCSRSHESVENNNDSMQLPDLEDQVSDSLADAALEDLRLDFRSIVLRHHAATGDLNRLIEVFLGFVRSHLVTITPMTDVNDESRLHVYWLSATLPPSKPSCVAFRYLYLPFHATYASQLYWSLVPDFLFTTSGR